MDRSEQPVILLLGSPRSGTTWLAKIFDSHSRVIYRHEPDSVLKSPAIPFVPELADLGDHTDQAREYLHHLMQVKSSKAAGSLPMFRKRYRGPVKEYGRRLQAGSARVLEALGAKMGSKLRPNIPDWLKKRGQAQVVYVMKSVDSLTRTRLFAEAIPEARIIHIIRHPCAFVASELRGEKLNLMQIETFIGAQVQMSQAKRRGLNLEKLKGLSREGQLASLWMLQNEKVMEEMNENPNYRIVVYEDLCRSPLRVARETFDFCGLEWDPQTEEFIGLSLDQRSGGRERYFQVVRNPLQAAFKWRQELTETQVNNIMQVVTGSLPGKLYERADRSAMTPGE